MVRGQLMAEKRKELGRLGERIAQEHLRQHGYRIKDTNYRCSHGEIDIIAEDGDCLVFVEVRTRRGRRFGTPEESITAAKSLRLATLAEFYLQTLETPPLYWRIDVVAVELTAGGKLTRVEIIPNAVN